MNYKYHLFLIFTGTLWHVQCISLEVTSVQQCPSFSMPTKQDVVQDLKYVEKLEETAQYTVQ